MAIFSKELVKWNPPVPFFKKTAGALSPKLQQFPPIEKCMIEVKTDTASVIRYSNDTDHSVDIHGIVVRRLFLTIAVSANDILKICFKYLIYSNLVFCKVFWIRILKFIVKVVMIIFIFLFVCVWMKCSQLRGLKLYFYKVIFLRCDRERI